MCTLPPDGTTKPPLSICSPVRQRTVVLPPCLGCAVVVFTRSITWNLPPWLPVGLVGVAVGPPFGLLGSVVGVVVGGVPLPLGSLVVGCVVQAEASSMSSTSARPAKPPLSRARHVPNPTD